MENLQAAFFSKSRTDPINWNKTRATSDLEREQTSTQTPEASTSHGSFNQRTEEKEESQQQGGHTNEDQMRSQNYVPQQKVELLGTSEIFTSLVCKFFPKNIKKSLEHQHYYHHQPSATWPIFKIYCLSYLW